jgi:hypothetical protein
MALTISSTITSGFVLGAGDNPATILPSGRISNIGNALHGASGTYWTVSNYGTVLGGSAYTISAGIDLAGGGAVTNAAHAVVSGFAYALHVHGTGTVVNNGTIVSTAASLPAYRYFKTPSPSITAIAGGVVLGGGGVSNAAGATIAGVVQGVGLNGAGSLVNAGLVTASGTHAAAVLLGGADSVTNQSGGILSGGYSGILAAGAAVTVTNAGTIAGQAGFGVFLISGGTLENLTGLVSGAKYGIFAKQSATVENAGTIAGRYAVELVAGGTVDNPSGFISGSVAGILLSQGGYIRNGGTIAGNYAVFTTPSGTVVNTGAIAGGNYGVVLKGAGTLDNSGTITNTRTLADDTVNLRYGGSFTNEATGTVAGHWIGVGIGNATAAGTIVSTIVNAGSIGAVDAGGNGADLWLRGPVYVRNTGVISAGPFGLVLYDRSTVVNLGTITGAYDVVVAGTTHHEGPIVPGNAALAAATASLRLEVGPGAVFTGDITAPVGSGGAQANTLELLTGAGTGTISGFGARYESFGNIAIDHGAHWLVSGAAQGFAGGTISGLAAGSTLELTGTVETIDLLAGGILTLSGGTTLNLPGVAQAFVSNDGANTFVTACFASGTKLLAARGPVAVEALREGDLLVTARGLAPIRWIGHRRTEPRRHPAPHDVMPVRIRAGAFGDGMPLRDLVLSPDHAVFLDGALIPVRHLVNGISIAQEPWDRVTYWHVELARHDVVLAEGLACETYLDTGNRLAFENADGPVQLHPDFARAVWAERGCAPILTDPADPSLRAAHMGLLARASRYGSANSTSTGTWSEGCALARSSRSGAA